MKNACDVTNLVWIDLEMTGLNPSRDVILEIATIITDNQLNILAQGPELVIHHSDEVLEAMTPWVKDVHTRSGLVDAVKKSHVRLEQAEAETLEFVKQYVAPKTAPLCGNSIWMDRSFIRRYMTTLDDYLHYRMVDVTTVKILVHEWYKNIPVFKKSENHRALEDIRESIEELRSYRERFFIKM